MKRYTVIYQDRRSPPERVNTLTVVLLDRVERVHDAIGGRWLAPRLLEGAWVLVEEGA